MTKLADELITKANSAVSEDLALLDSAKQLLSSNEQREREVLRSIGLDTEIEYFELKNANIQCIKQYSDMYQVPVTTFENLQKFCVENALWIIKPKNYIGKIPPSLGGKVAKFVQRNSIPVSANYDYDSGFYMIAPYRLSLSFKNPHKAFFSSTIKDAQAAFNKFMDPDPILLYKVGYDAYGKPLFGIIESWGKDESMYRKIVSFYYRKVFNPLMILSDVIFALCVSLLFLNLAFNEAYHNLLQALFGIVSFIAFAYSVVSLIHTKSKLDSAKGANPITIFKQAKIHVE